MKIVARIWKFNGQIFFAWDLNTEIKMKNSLLKYID